MRLRTVKGSSMSEALDRVHRELGPNALVLETRTDGDVTEVVAAEVEREEPAEGLMRLRAELALLRRELGVNAGGFSRLRADLPALASQAASARSPRTAAAGGRGAAVEKRLREHGVHPVLVRRVRRMIDNAPPSEGDPVDPRTSSYALNAVAGLLPGAPAGSGKARAFLFLGPPGAGKTTTVAKLASQIAGAGRTSFATVTLDSEGPPVDDVLSRTAERLSVPHRRVRGAPEMARALEELADRRMLLIDTGPLSPRERRAIEHLFESKAAPGQVTAHLVMPANLEPVSMRSIAQDLLEFRPSAIVMTKVDETRRFGELLNLPADLGLPVSALCHGRRVDGDLKPGTRRLIAEIVLGRRSLAPQPADG